MVEFPKRKTIRIKEYDYSTSGAYFITVCTVNREKILWNISGDDTICPNNVPLSQIGKIVEQGILQIQRHYDNVLVDKYCIMPDHIHMILSINADDDGRQVAAPTISTIVGHMKRWVTMQIGHTVWQKSFVDRVIRNEKGYNAVWEYIENNPIKLDTADIMPDFEKM